MGENHFILLRLSEHVETKGCSDNWNVRISETILFVYKEDLEHSI